MQKLKPIKYNGFTIHISKNIRGVYSGYVQGRGMKMSLGTGQFKDKEEALVAARWAIDGMSDRRF